uniref:E2F transcription factor 3 n=1 Tax=Sinocyclocheilus grahami TaxID=75366 RepID=A0A672SHW7_SINGR
MPSHSLAREMLALTQEERRLDELIQTLIPCSLSLTFLTYAYVTYQDIRRIKSLKDQTVIAVKAPSETKLEVPDPKESLQVHLSSSKGPIDVFLCTDGGDSGSLLQNGLDVNGNHPAFLKFPSSVFSCSLFFQNLSSLSSILQQPEESIPFVPLSPALLSDEYMLGLGDEQGISDLFDSCDLDTLALDDLLRI